MLNTDLEMEEKDIEKLHKIEKANRDIQKGRDLLKDLHNKSGAAEKFVDDCRRNPDYFMYINLHPTINKYRGELQFHQLDFKIKLKILKSIIEAIEVFIIEESK